MPLTITIPLVAACGYAVFGWNRLTAWWAAIAAALTAIAAVWIPSSPAAVFAGFIAAGAAAAFAVAPALLANDLADHRTGTRAARVFGTGSCLILAASQLAICATGWWARVAGLLFAVGCCWLLIAVRRRPVTRAAARHMAIVVGPASGAIIIGLLIGIDSPAGNGAALLGLATVAGVAPWSAWLCQAHRAATTPVATLLSVMVVPVAWYQLWLLRETVSVVLWLVMAGVALLIAAVVAIRATDIRVLPPAATIAHFGVATAAAATVTDVWWIAGLLLASGLSAAAASATAGHTVALIGSGRVRGLWRRHRWLATLTALAMTAMLVTPVMAAVLVTRWWWVLVAAAYVTCAVALASRTLGMLRGDAGGHVVVGTARPMKSGTVVVPGILVAWVATFVAGLL